MSILNTLFDSVKMKERDIIKFLTKEFSISEESAIRLCEDEKKSELLAEIILDRLCLDKEC